MKIPLGISYREAAGQKAIPAKVAAMIRANEESGKRAALKLYHGSQKKFEPGTILAPQAEGYATSTDPMIRQTERIVESQRPKGALPRKNSVFMVHDPDEIDYAGGYTDYVYEVEPIGKVEKNDMGWYSDVSVHWWDKENDPGALKTAKNYWSGKPYGKSGLWEYRATKAKVVRLVSAEKIAAKQEPAMLGSKWNPKANLGYHWTDAENLQAILDSGSWEAGSVTTNPAYRFSKGVLGETRYALVFNLSKGFKPREDPTVPWKEWEWLADNDVNIWDMPDGTFLGFGVRSSKAADEIRAMLKEDFDEPDMFPIAIVPTVTKAATLQNYMGNCTDRNHKF